MRKYRINRSRLYVGSAILPGRKNPIPTRTEPQPEHPEQEPDRVPKRKKKSIYEIVMGYKLTDMHTFTIFLP